MALSGGATQGSFQAGALECLYTQFGYRPDVISGTSVGSVNGLAIAQGSTPDEQLDQLGKLLDVWRNLSEPRHVYITEPWVARLTRSDGLAFSSLPSPQAEDAIVELLLYDLTGEIGRTSALAVLDPLETKMRDPVLYDKDKLAAGVPLRMVCVSLETGRVRYATGRGLFLEDDNFTPVASALPRVGAIRVPHDNFTSAIGTVRTLMQAIADVKDHGDKETKAKTLPRLGIDLESAHWRAETAYEQLAAANASLPTPIQATVNPVIGALASSAIPGIFQAYKIREEHYIDGGVRETVPVKALVQMGATEVTAIVCSPQRMPKAGDASHQDFLTNLLGSLTGITLKEVVEDDLAGRGTAGVPVTRPARSSSTTSFSVMPVSRFVRKSWWLASPALGMRWGFRRSRSPRGTHLNKHFHRDGLRARRHQCSAPPGSCRPWKIPVSQTRRSSPDEPWIGVGRLAFAAASCS